LEKDEVNAGVRALNGFALQRNTALFILLDNYNNKFKEKNYFISLEHHDDFLFCFYNDNHEIDYTEAYQSKKKSNGMWTITNKLAEIITKLIKTGIDLHNDDITKSISYSQKLYFSSNSPMSFKTKNTDGNISKIVNEENSSISFKALRTEIQEKILTQINTYLNDGKKDQKDLPMEFLEEISNLNFLYITFTTTDKEQQNQLIGKLQEIFKDQIIDYRAAVNSILSLFNHIETIYNQGHVSKLLDKSKQVSSKDLNTALKIITTRTKAFNYWRDQTKQVSETLEIKPFDKDIFEETFVLAFDLFKSIKETGHKSILTFVKENYRNCESYTEGGIVLELYNLFKNKNASIFDNFHLKAIIYAAYFEACNKRE